MNTIISNKIFIEQPTQAVYLWCKDNLVIENPVYRTYKKIGKDDLIRWYHIPPTLNLWAEDGLNLVLPFGCLKGIWHLIKDSPYSLLFNNSGDLSNKNEKITTPLYDYQEKAVEKLIAAKGGFLQSSAGSGKTNIGLALINRIGKRALWLTNKTDLLNQSMKRCKELFPHSKCGTITAGEIKMDEITFATIQTMITIDPDIYKDKFDVIVVDEAHAVSGSPTLSKMFYKVINKIPARYKYGLSASKREDTLSKSMFCALGMSENGEFKETYKIDRDKTNQLTAKHIRIDLDTPMDYSFLNEDGTYNYMNLIDSLSKNDNRNNAIVSNIISASKVHKKQIALCLRVEQCETIYKKLLEKGIKAVLLIGKVTDKKRKEILEEKIDFEVLVGTFSIAKEGLDYPKLSCLHLCSIISDSISVIQSTGRIERVCENKPEPIVYDYVDKNIMYAVGKYNKRARILRNRR